VTSLAAGQSAWLPQLTENALFRTNIGITNAGTAAANVTVTLFDSAGNQMWSNSLDYTPGQFYQYQQPYLGLGGIDSGVCGCDGQHRIGVWWHTPR
jgi:hypothetical protein